MMIRYICETCGAAFDVPFSKVTTVEWIGGFPMQDRQELCPVCFEPYITAADECECGQAKPADQLLCKTCRRALLVRFNEFADCLTACQEEQLDDWLNGSSIKDRRKWGYGHT